MAKKNISRTGAPDSKAGAPPLSPAAPALAEQPAAPPVAGHAPVKAEMVLLVLCGYQLGAVRGGEIVTFDSRWLPADAKPDPGISARIGEDVFTVTKVAVNNELVTLTVEAAAV